MTSKPRFVVDLQVTGKCNLACDFCAGVPKEHAGARLKDILNGIDKLVKAGLTTLNISGGEPLVRKDTPQILSHARSKGIEVYLSTNGLLLERFYDQVIPHITTLGLALDGSTPEMSIAMTRGSKQFDTTLHFLRRFKRAPPSFSVKVGTVVSAINLRDILNIGSVLFEDDTIHAPDVWRLYEFTPGGEGRFSKDRHFLPTASFDKIVRQVKSAFPARIIMPLSNEDSNDSYIFVDPRLLIQIYRNNGNLVIGDLQEMTVKDLLDLKSRYLAIVAKGGKNREWLSLGSKQNVG